MHVKLNRRVVLLQPTEQTTELQEQVPGDPVRWRTWANARDVRGAEGVGLSGGPVEAQSSEVQRVYRIRQRRFGDRVTTSLVLGGPSKRIPRCTRCAT